MDVNNFVIIIWLLAVRVHDLTIQCDDDNDNDIDDNNDDNDDGNYNNDDDLPSHILLIEQYSYEHKPS
jgi:hypothetical protein